MVHRRAVIEIFYEFKLRRSMRATSYVYTSYVGYVKFEIINNNW